MMAIGVVMVVCAFLFAFITNDTKYDGQKTAMVVGFMVIAGIALFFASILVAMWRHMP
jgi:hypothetical protein